MDVMISDQVHEVIMDFYEASKHLHITLDEETVAKKMLRIYDKVNDLGNTSVNFYRKIKS